MMSGKILLLALEISLAFAAGDKNVCPVNSKVTGCKLITDQTGQYYKCYASWCYGEDCLEKKEYYSLCQTGLKYDHFSCFKQNCVNNTEMHAVECECTDCQPSIYQPCDDTTTTTTSSRDDVVLVAEAAKTPTTTATTTGTCHSTAEVDFCAKRYGEDSYCGDSAQQAARVPDGSGCSCNWDCVYGPKSGDAPWLGAICKCPAKPPVVPPCLGQCCQEKPDFCASKAARAYCGKSDQEFARFTDGSGCSCKWNEEYSNGKCTPKDERVYV